MTVSAPTYDLVMLLDASAQEDARAKLVADAKAMVEGRGQLLRHDHWGDRQMAYPIGGAKDADYHLLQFHASTPELLAELSRTLRITDGIIRFRIIKLEPGTPDAPEMTASTGAPRQHEQEPKADPERAKPADGMQADSGEPEQSAAHQ